MRLKGGCVPGILGLYRGRQAKSVLGTGTMKSAPTISRYRPIVARPIAGACLALFSSSMGQVFSSAMLCVLPQKDLVSQSRTACANNRTLLLEHRSWPRRDGCIPYVPGLLKIMKIYF